MHTLQTIAEPKFVAFRSRLTQYPRMDGYYLVDIVSIESMRTAGCSQEEILDTTFEHFDDQDWPPPEARPLNIPWSADAVDSDTAERVVMRALIGGREVGHTMDTIPPDVAGFLWSEFQGFFPGSRRTLGRRRRLVIPE
jgi:hypothetical protein